MGTKWGGKMGTKWGGQNGDSPKRGQFLIICDAKDSRDSAGAEARHLVIAANIPVFDFIFAYVTV
jgi:hypothetical protein